MNKQHLQNMSQSLWMVMVAGLKVVFTQEFGDMLEVHFRVSEIVQAASDFGVQTLTLYSFSTENWGRPQKEIDALFKLLKKFLKKERNRIISNDIKFRVIGDFNRTPP